MKKYLLGSFLSLFFLFVSVTTAWGQNKVGVNIGDHWLEFDQAAALVGNGGWIVVMACPGDGDKIAGFLKKHPDINLIIRGHYPKHNPDENLAEAWAQTLAAIASDQSIPAKRIYFVPWNEPNQANGDDGTDPTTLKNYIVSLNIQLNNHGLFDRISLLSPMMNQTYAANCDPSTNSQFLNYVAQLNQGGNFFKQFSGIAMNLYDNEDCGSPLCCQNPNFNASRFNDVLQQMGVPGKKVFAVESGVVRGKSVRYNDGDLDPFFHAAFNAWHSQSNFVMSAVFSYDPEHKETWNLFSSSTGQFFGSYGGKGCCTQDASSSNIKPPSGNKCEGKTYTYYIADKSECNSCGGFSLAYCKPLPADRFGEEYSKESLHLTEKVFNTFDNVNACNLRDFTGKMAFTDMSIPLAYELNQYYLGPYLDDLGARLAKEKPDPMADFGVFEKLAPQQLQDQLRQEFLQHVIDSGAASRYAGFQIRGLAASRVLERFRNGPDEDFLKTVWPQVPLFANKESQGEIVFEGSGISGSVKTSVPEVDRLNRVTTLINQMLLPATATNAVQGAKAEAQTQVLAACDTGNVSRQVSNKETMTGPGSQVCTKEEIQPSTENNLIGSRPFSQDVFGPSDAGGCDGKTVNSCCQNGKKCILTAGGSDVYPYHCDDNPDPLVDPYGEACACSDSGCGPDGTCWAEDQDWRGCQIRARDYTFDVDVNIKNRVPYLDQIAENTVGEKGFYHLFIPYLTQVSALKPVITHVFGEVAGEAPANLTFNSIKVVNGPIEVNPSESNNVIHLLFYKLGTLFNVKGYVAGEVLWPFKKPD